MTYLRRPSALLHAGGATYSLDFTINAMCALEDLLDKPAPGVLADLMGSAADPRLMRMQTVRAVLWSMLRDNHPEIDIEGAGRIASDAGTKDTMAAIMQAVAVAFPPPEKAKGKEKAPAEASPPAA